MTNIMAILQETAVPVSFLMPLIQFGSFGVLVALIWHIVKVQIPAQDKRADDRQSAFLAAIDKVHADCAQERESMIAMYSDRIAQAQANFHQEMSHFRNHTEKENEKILQAIRSKKEFAGGQS